MPVLQQDFVGNHGYPSDRRLKEIPRKYDDDDGWNRMNNFGRQKMGRTGWSKYENYGDPGGGGGKGIEFRADNNKGGEESGISSPPLWKRSPTSSPPLPTETTPLQSQPYNHHHYRLLSPESRTQMILRGRQELMDMVKQMPETSYELSLKDLVELPRVEVVERKTGFAEEREFSNGGGMSQAEKKRRMRGKRNEKDKMGRCGSGSLNHNSNSNHNGPFLLKMFFPVSFGWKQKSSTNGTCAKVSPRPWVEGEKGEKGEKDWWKKRFSVAGDSGRSGSSGGSSSGGSSGGSRNSSRSRNMGAFLPACWPWIWTKKRNPRDQKESIF